MYEDAPRSVGTAPPPWHDVYSLDGALAQVAEGGANDGANDGDDRQKRPRDDDGAEKTKKTVRKRSETSRKRFENEPKTIRKN